MNPSIFIWLVYACWIFLVAFLTVTAISVKPDTEGHPLQSFGLLIAIVAAFLLPRLPFFGFVNFAPVGPALSVVGLIVMAAGAVLLVWGRLRLGKNWSQTVSAKREHALVTSGPYRLVRHPMYAGGIVACIGSAIVAGGAFVFLLIILTPLFLWRVGAEDRLMARQFPNQYPEYRKRSWALIPFIY
jgi:protein-S-isoprenylcysteine O-methyltransferase Ste14